MFCDGRCPKISAMHPITAYLEHAQRIHGFGGVKEASYYPALDNLFNTIGKAQKPPVYCVSILGNVGAGFPDGGFFTKSQNQALEKEADADKKKSLLKSAKPERGVLEVKGAAQDLGALIQSEQVLKYLSGYGLVLVTNLRQFALERVLNPCKRMRRKAAQTREMQPSTKPIRGQMPGSISLCCSRRCSFWPQSLHA
jgi:hypothetical protein